MDEAKTFLLGVMQTARERFGNPLISAFAIAWAIWNFRLLLVLIGNGEGGWQAKITYIDTRLMPHWWNWAWHGFLVPAISALAWIYLLPPLLRKVASDHEKHQNQTRDAIFAATESRTLSADEALTLRSVMVKQRAEWHTEKAETVASLEGMKKVNESQSVTLASYERKISELEAALEKLKTPPPPKPFDYSGKPTKDKARACGVVLHERSLRAPPLIAFDGQFVEWPWAPRPEHAINIPNDRFAKAQIGEETVLAMFHLQEITRKGARDRTLVQWADALQDIGISRPEEQVVTLLNLGILHGNRDVPSFPLQSDTNVSWLRNVGFGNHSAGTSTS